MSITLESRLSSPVLVTGGAGFIGSHLVEELVSLGLDVRVLDDLSSGNLENLAGARDHITFVQGDIRDRALVEKMVAGVQIVFHLAARPSVLESVQEPSLCLAINGQGTLNVMELAARAGVQRLVYASTSAVYGDLPAPHREESRPVPNSPYAAIKLLGEHLGQYYREALGLVTISVRFFNVYGLRQTASGQDSGVIPIFLEALKNNQPPLVYGDGSQTRDFIHVSDAVRALILSAQVIEPAQTVFNVGTGHQETILALLGYLRKLFPKAPEPIYAPARPGDPLRSGAVIDHARKILGFEAKVGLEEGLRHLTLALEKSKSN